MEKDQAEFPLLNPVLLNIARREIALNGDRKLLEELLRSDWKDFHDEKTREMNYALSWSIIYHLLTRELPQELSLKEKINRINAMNKDELTGLESRWRESILKLDLVDELTRLSLLEVPGKKMTSLWAIDELSKVRGKDVRRSLKTLTGLFEAPCTQTREEAYIAFLRLLSTNPQAPFLEPRHTSRALAHLQAIITDRKAAPELRDWVPLLIETLEDSRPLVRAAAASALSKMAAKPTVVSPAFWTSAPTSKRDEEIGEWKKWLAKRNQRQR
jgi:hypothetical protein